MHTTRCAARLAWPLRAVLSILSVLCLSLGLAAPARAAGPKIAVLSATYLLSSSNDIKSRLDSTALFGAIDVIDITGSALTAARLKGYDAALIVGDAYGRLYDTRSTDAALAQYLDAGGGLVLAAPYVAHQLSGDFYTRYGLIDNLSPSYVTNLSLGTVTSSCARRTWATSPPRSRSAPTCPSDTRTRSR